MDEHPDRGETEGAADEAQRPQLIADNQGLIGEGLYKSIKGRDILRDVHVAVNRGEVIGLLGPNGAGKTTSFYLLTGLMRADRGRIALDGLDVTDLPLFRRARLGIGYLPQEPSVFRGMTVEGNLLALLEANEPDRNKREALAEELMEEFHISRLRNASALSLSGGERRRLEIARALTSRPHILLLDEPLTGIDPIAIDELRELILHLRDRGLGVLITDHNVRETLAMVDRAYVLHDGAVLAEGAPHQIVANDEVRRVFLGQQFRL